MCKLYILIADFSVHQLPNYIRGITEENLLDTVEPCTLAQSDHLWGLVVTKPVILSKKGINMTWCRYIGLQYIQRSAF